MVTGKAAFFVEGNSERSVAGADLQYMVSAFVFSKKNAPAAAILAAAIIFAIIIAMVVLVIILNDGVRNFIIGIFNG